jgi:hypothetical protein
MLMLLVPWMRRTMNLFLVPSHLPLFSIRTPAGSHIEYHTKKKCQSNQFDKKKGILIKEMVLKQLFINSFCNSMFLFAGLLEGKKIVYDTQERRKKARNTK